SPSALMISMGVNLMRDRVGGHVASAGFDFGKEAFEVQLADGRLVTRSVDRPDAPFVLTGSGNALAAAIYGTAPLSLLIAKGFVGAHGDIAAAQKFVDLFALRPQT